DRKSTQSGAPEAPGPVSHTMRSVPACAPLVTASAHAVSRNFRGGFMSRSPFRAAMPVRTERPVLSQAPCQPHVGAPRRPLHRTPHFGAGGGSKYIVRHDNRLGCVIARRQVLALAAATLALLPGPRSRAAELKGDVPRGCVVTPEQ